MNNDMRNNSNYIYLGNSRYVDKRVYEKAYTSYVNKIKSGELQIPKGDSSRPK